MRCYLGEPYWPKKVEAIVPIGLNVDSEEYRRICDNFQEEIDNAIREEEAGRRNNLTLMDFVFTE